MYKIIGLPINFRYIGGSNLKPIEETSDSLRIRKICEFGLKYGYKAAAEAFEISKSSYYIYLAKYKLSQELNVALKIGSKCPHKRRVANWNKKIISFICRMRADHANIGKDKIKFYLDKFCIKCGLKPISTGTIQNIINSYPNKLRTKKSILNSKRRENVIRKPKNYKALASGECISLDSMEFRQDGKKLYVVVAQDEATNLMYARATNSHTSRSAKEIFESAHNYLPWDEYNIILTDNGSEFGKDFAKYVKENKITHYHTYPKTPKQNARCERLNRTIQDEFMIKYTNLLFSDIQAFNRELNTYLRWYNFERVHARFGNKMTPFERHRQLINNGRIST